MKSGLQRTDSRISHSSQYTEPVRALRNVAPPPQLSRCFSIAFFPLGKSELNDVYFPEPFTFDCPVIVTKLWDSDVPEIFGKIGEMRENTCSVRTAVSRILKSFEKGETKCVLFSTQRTDKLFSLASVDS